MMVFDQLRVPPGGSFRLSERDPAATPGFTAKKDGKDRLESGISRLCELQEKLYAQDRWALLLIFQAMDAAGKDSTIEHVMSGINPQGCQVFSFKAPSNEELDHDFLWRTNRCLPERGRIGIFNRSYYEEVLIVRVHPGILAGQKLPGSLVTKRVWQERYEDINASERYLTRNGIAIRKFFLHVSKEEQRRRFLDRLEEPEKNWKFSVNDAKERDHWEAYMQAYEDCLRATSTEHAPWYVVPADHKWYMRMAVAELVVQALEGLDLEFPKIDKEQRAELEEARKLLEAEGGKERGKKHS
ncbi:MAG TPA: polyphosphate kinase 2 family protein [Vicinamibacteria bacterium]